MFFIEDEEITKCKDLAIAELIKQLGASTDPETAHVEADELIVSLLERFKYKKTAKAFRELKKWYA